METLAAHVCVPCRACHSPERNAVASHSGHSTGVTCPLRELWAAAELRANEVFAGHPRRQTHRRRMRAQQTSALATVAIRPSHGGKDQPPRIDPKGTPLRFAWRSCFKPL